MLPRMEGAVSDRLERIQEILDEEGDFPMQSAKLMVELQRLFLEELKYLRDKNAELSNAAKEFARLVRP